MRNDAGTLRKERIRRINGMIEAHKTKGINKIFLKKFIALVQFNIGLTKPRIIEYLGILEDLGHIEISSNMDQILIKEE